jgi:hypothetical protein
MADYAILDEEGNVVNIIVADQEFIDSLTSQIQDESVDTGTLSETNEFVELSEDLDTRPGVGWKHQGGEWVAPEPVEPEDVPEPEQTLAEEVLSDPILSDFSPAEKAAVERAIRAAQERGRS